MSSQLRDHSRTRGCHSLYLIYILFAVIFFLLLVVLAFLGVALVYQLGHDDTRMQLYLEHYGRNWLSVLIFLFTVIALLIAFVLVLFSIYLLKVHQNTSQPGDLPLRRHRNRNRSFKETTTTNTVTRTCANQVGLKLTHPKLQRKCLVENIHMEKSITFH